MQCQHDEVYDKTKKIKQRYKKGKEAATRLTLWHSNKRKGVKKSKSGNDIKISTWATLQIEYLAPDDCPRHETDCRALE